MAGILLKTLPEWLVVKPNWQSEGCMS